MTSLSFAQYDRPGSTDAQFLKIGVSPRGTGMGDAYIASVKNAEATQYNIAALPWVNGTDIVLNHNQWFASINHEFLSVVKNFGDLGTVGLSATALYTDEMIVRTPLQPEGTGETFYAANYKFGLSYARFLTDRVTMGASVSYIRMGLYQDFVQSGISIDIATMYVSDFRGFKFGMQISNFGSNIQYVNESYPIPTSFTFGCAINAVDEDDYKLLTSFSAVKPNEGQPQAQVGIEFGFQNILFLRGGYKINHSVATYTGGLGLQTDISGFLLRFDYSYCQYEILGAAQRFGLGIGISDQLIQ
jgi:hypothetical protein